MKTNYEVRYASNPTDAKSYDTTRLRKDFLIENVFVKNPSESKIRHLIRETVMSVDEVTDVTEISFSLNNRTREAAITVSFTTDEDTFREEVNIKWQNTD